MNRVAILLACLLLVGCQGPVPADSSASPSDSSPPSAGSPPCSPGDRSTDDGNERLTPKPGPDWLSNLSSETAGSFVRSFEEVYAWNDALSDEIQSVTVSVFVTNVSRVSVGYVVTLGVEAGYTERITVDDGTPIEQIADDWYTAAYYVTDEFLKRSVARSGSDTLDPRNGTVVACAD